MHPKAKDLGREAGREIIQPLQKTKVCPGMREWKTPVGLGVTLHPHGKAGTLAGKTGNRRALSGDPECSAPDWEWTCDLPQRPPRDSEVFATGMKPAEDGRAVTGCAGEQDVWGESSVKTLPIVLPLEIHRSNQQEPCLGGSVHLMGRAVLGLGNTWHHFKMLGVGSRKQTGYRKRFKSKITAELKQKCFWKS